MASPPRGACGRAAVTTRSTSPIRAAAHRRRCGPCSGSQSATPEVLHEQPFAQHLGSISSAEKSKGWRFVLALLRSPMWLAGSGALAGGFVFQALALHVGQLSVVQPLLITELVFALALRRAWLRQPIRGVTWWAAALACISLSVFLAMSEPQGG